MKKDRKDRLQGGFTIAELLMSMFIVMVIAVAMVPIIGPKKIQTPIVAGTHGIYECYYDPTDNLLKEYNPSVSQDASPVQGDHCEFTPSPGNSYQLYLIPASATGYQNIDDLTYEYIDVTDNVLNAENGILDTENSNAVDFQARLGNLAFLHKDVTMTDFANEIRYGYTDDDSFSEQLKTNPFLVSFDDPGQMLTEGAVNRNIGSVLINTFYDWQGGRDNVQPDGMYLEFSDIHSPVGHAGLGYTRLISASTKKVNNKACETLLNGDNPSQYLIPNTSYWSTKNRTEADGKLRREDNAYCAYLLNLRGGDSEPGYFFNGTALFPFNAAFLREGNHSVTLNEGTAAWSYDIGRGGTGDENGLSDLPLSIQVFDNQLKINSSAGGYNAPGQIGGSPVDADNDPSLHVPLASLGGNCIADPSCGGQSQILFGRQRRLLKIENFQYADASKNSGLERGKLDSEGLSEPGDNFENVQRFYNDINDDNDMSHLGGFDTGYMKFHTHPFSWTMTQPAVQINYGGAGHASILHDQFTSEDVDGTLRLFPAINSQSPTKTEDNNGQRQRWSQPSQNGQKRSIISRIQGSIDTIETTLNNMYNTIHVNAAVPDDDFIRMDNFIAELESAAQQGFDGGIYTFCQQNNNNRCPGHASSGSYPLVDWVRANITVRMQNNQTISKGDHTYITKRTNRQINNRIANCANNFGHKDDDVFTNQPGVHNSIRYCSANNDNIQNPYGAIIITW